MHVRLKAVLMAAALLGSFGLFTWLWMPAIRLTQPPAALTPAPDAPEPFARPRPAPRAIQRPPTALTPAPTAPDALAPAPAEPFTRARPTPWPIQPPTALTPVPAVPTETVDAVLKRLAAGVVAFNIPARMRLARTQTVEARLGVNMPREQLVREITAEGEVKTVSLRVSPRMQATLLGGSAFDISPSGPQIQFVSNEESNTWQWDVTPKLEGQQVLVLTFDAFIEVGGQEGLHTVNTLRQPIVVEVGWPETPQEWAEWLRKWVEYGGWLWTTLLVPAGLFVLHGWRKFRAKSAATTTPVNDPHG